MSRKRWQNQERRVAKATMMSEIESAQWWRDDGVRGIKSPKSILCPNPGCSADVWGDLDDPDSWRWECHVRGVLFLKGDAPSQALAESRARRALKALAQAHAISEETGEGQTDERRPTRQALLRYGELQRARAERYRKDAEGLRELLADERLLSYEAAMGDDL